MSKILLLNEKQQLEKKSFLKTLQEEKSLDKITKSLESFHELEYNTFKKELKKQKVTIPLGDENNEWREYFEQSKQKISMLQSEISQIDKEIDQLVYELYGLTEEEIAIVENS